MDWQNFSREERAECRDCPRFARGIFVPPDIKPNAKVATVAEAPGRQEAAQGVTLIGPAGRVHDMLLTKAGMSRETTSCMNACMCYLEPPHGKKDIKPTNEELRSCSGLLETAISDAHASVLVAMGGTAAARLVGIKRDFTKRVGAVTYTEAQVTLGKGRIFGPDTFKSGKRKGEPKPHQVELKVEQTPGRTVVTTFHPAEVMYSDMMTAPLVAAHLRRARRLAEGERLVDVSARVEVTVQPIGRALEVLERRSFCLDLETSIETGAIELVGLSAGPGHGVVFEPSAPLLRALDAALCKRNGKTLIGHNVGQFDVARLRENEVRVEANLWDTIHAAQYERPDLRRKRKTVEGTNWNEFAGLGLVTSRFDDIYYDAWKESFKEGEQANRVLYCAKDCSATSAIAQRLYARLEATGRLRHFERWMMPALYALMDMERDGVRVDQEQRANLRTKQETLERSLVAAWEAIAPNVDPASQTQLKDYFYGTLHLKPKVDHETGRPTLDKEAIEELEQENPERLELRLCLDLRHVRKILSTYLRTEGDRVYTQYNLSGAQTGRLSSDFQQLPRAREGCARKVQGCVCGETRSMFVADEGDEAFVCADFEQIEFRLIGVLSKDLALKRDYATPGFDIHAKVAARLKVDRNEVAKNVVYGVAFGQQEVGLQRELKKKGLKFSQAECRAFIQGFLAMYPQVEAYWSRQVLDARKVGYTQNPFGRMLFYRVGKDGKVDVPKVRAGGPQSTNADVHLVALTRARAAGLKLRFSLHDEIGISARTRDDARLLKEVMESPIEELGNEGFPVDVGLGRTWSEAKSKEARVL